MLDERNSGSEPSDKEASLEHDKAPLSEFGPRVLPVAPTRLSFGEVNCSRRAHRGTLNGFLFLLLRSRRVLESVRADSKADTRIGP